MTEKETSNLIGVAICETLDMVSRDLEREAVLLEKKAVKETDIPTMLSSTLNLQAHELKRLAKKYSDLKSRFQT